MMKYDFNTVIDRYHTHSYKWDGAEKIQGDKDLLPLWIADMDFRSPEAVIEALKTRVDHGIFGYTMPPDSCYEAIAGWLKKRHGWEIEKEWIEFTPGVVSGVSLALKAATRPGDKVIIQPPVYFPFMTAVEHIGCHIVENQLIYRDGRYTIDFDDLERKFDDRTTAYILCNPHNPVGRVWTEEELRRVAELCVQHHVMVCSDEIHSDLIFAQHKHIPIASLSEDIAQQTITCLAANKTFNIAGLNTAVAIIPDPQLRREFQKVRENVGVGSCNLLGMLATEAAYTHGEAWLEQVLCYIHENLEFLNSYVESNIPRMKVIQPEGTFLVWLDCRELQLDDAALEEFMLRKAKVWLSHGPIFGSGGSGFMRLNLGCSRSTLEHALQRIERAVHDLGEVEDKGQSY